MRKLVKFKELTKKQKENRIAYLGTSLGLYLAIMFLIVFKFTIPAVNSISLFMLQALKFTQPSDPISFIVYYGITLILGTTSPLIITVLFFDKSFDRLFFKLKVDIGIKNE